MRNKLDRSISRVRRIAPNSGAFAPCESVDRGPGGRHLASWFCVVASVALGACSVDDRELGVAEPTLLPDSGAATANDGTSCVPGETKCLSATE
jgi:hypothetical protein